MREERFEVDLLDILTRANDGQSYAQLTSIKTYRWQSVAGALTKLEDSKYIEKHERRPWYSDGKWGWSDTWRLTETGAGALERMKRKEQNIIYADIPIMPEPEDDNQKILNEFRRD